MAKYPAKSPNESIISAGERSNGPQGKLVKPQAVDAGRPDRLSACCEIRSTSGNLLTAMPHAPAIMKPSYRRNCSKPPTSSWIAVEARARPRDTRVTFPCGAKLFAPSANVRCPATSSPRSKARRPNASFDTTDVARPPVAGRHAKGCLSPHGKSKTSSGSNSARRRHGRNWQRPIAPSKPSPWPPSGNPSTSFRRCRFCPRWSNASIFAAKIQCFKLRSMVACVIS